MEQTYIYSAKVVKIVDADTMDLLVNLGFKLKVEMRFRIADYDAPEIYHPPSEPEKIHGKEATERTKVLMPVGSEVMVKSRKMVGKYGRYIADIELANGEDFATKMIQEGFSKRETY